MSTGRQQPSSELTPGETTEMLRRILGAVEKNERKRWVEIACAVVLSLATMASAWCAYQSTLWGGVQTFRLAAASKAGRDGAEANVAALQFRAFDASMFINYIQAKSEGNQKMEEFLYRRFRPEVRPAVDAWLKTEPFNNPSAPQNPFWMAEYVQAELAEAKRQDELAAQKLTAAEEANETSDTYVLLTVMFASVLFFGGIGGTFESPPLRRTMAVMALVLFVVVLIVLATMPICRE